MHAQVPENSCRSQGLEAQNYYFLCICNLIRSHCFCESFFFFLMLMSILLSLSNEKFSLMSKHPYVNFSDAAYINTIFHLVEVLHIFRSSKLVVI